MELIDLQHFPRGPVAANGLASVIDPRRFPHDPIDPVTEIDLVSEIGPVTGTDLVSETDPRHFPRGPVSVIGLVMEIDLDTVGTSTLAAATLTSIDRIGITSTTTSTTTGAIPAIDRSTPDGGVAVIGLRIGTHGTAPDTGVGIGGPVARQLRSVAGSSDPH